MRAYTIYLTDSGSGNTIVAVHADGYRLIEDNTLSFMIITRDLKKDEIPDEVDKRTVAQFHPDHWRYWLDLGEVKKE
jgi:hypothetical protein